MGDTKRKMLTPAERVAKAKADLEVLEAAAQEKAAKRSAVLLEQKDKLLGQIHERALKIRVIEDELVVLGFGGELGETPALTVVTDDESAAV